MLTNAKTMPSIENTWYFVFQSFEIVRKLDCPDPEILAVYMIKFTMVRILISLLFSDYFMLFFQLFIFHVFFSRLSKMCYFSMLKKLSTNLMFGVKKGKLLAF